MKKKTGKKQGRNLGTFHVNDDAISDNLRGLLAIFKIYS